MKTTLEHIATIQTGVFAKPVAEGQLVYLQARHISENGKIADLLHPDLKAEDVNNKHILKPGDVLFAAKGSKNFAAVIEESILPSVASTSLFVIRLKDHKVLPQYLAWFINSQNTQQYLKSTAIGSSMVSISKIELENLEIPVPSIQMQKAILTIVNYRNKEKELKQKIENLRDKLIQQKIVNVLK